MTTTVETRTEFIARLGAERRRRGFSQNRLAPLIGVRQQVLNSWEAGKSKPTRQNLVAWAKALGVPPHPESTDPVRSECGSYKGYQIHKRRGEPKCGPCKDANAKYTALHRFLRQYGTPSSVG